MTDIGKAVKDSGKQAEDSAWLDHFVRFGLVAYGVVHLLVAWVALQLAWGERSQKASNEGAFQELAAQSYGTASLWAVVVGMAVLVAWRLLEAVFGHRDEEGVDRWRKRAVSVMKAVIYGAIAVSALRILLGDSGGKDKPWTAQVMGWPAGQWIVALVGLGVIAYAGNTAWRGWQEKYLEHLDSKGQTGEDGRAYRWFGKVGYIAKGIAIALVGGLVVHAGVTHESKGDDGLDDALRTVLEQPFGPWLLSAIALGLACYGLFCFARAKHLDR